MPHLCSGKMEATAGLTVPTPFMGRMPAIRFANLDRIDYENHALTIYPDDEPGGRHESGRGRGTPDDSVWG
ncbi:hypothetical protein OKHIL_38370 [Mycolicibacterium mageritense]